MNKYLGTIVYDDQIISPTIDATSKAEATYALQTMYGEDVNIVDLIGLSDLHTLQQLLNSGDEGELQVEYIHTLNGPNGEWIDETSLDAPDKEVAKTIFEESGAPVNDRQTITVEKVVDVNDFDVPVRGLVIITVSGGVAEVHTATNGIHVEIVDLDNTPDAKIPDQAANRVVVQVRGGVAVMRSAPAGIDVIIRDFDNETE